ncbi:MAG: CapA family protein [Pseudomonadota bacterium]|nr:CapA family protein [Pseudomonadota bacterium]
MVSMNLEQFKSPYGFKHSAAWVWRFLRGGDFKNPLQLHDIPKCVEVASGACDLKLGFVGDLMGTSGKKLRFSPLLKNFVEDCDFLVSNLEGPLVEKRDLVFIKQFNHPRILEDLNLLKPLGQWVFGLANNHSFDYGVEGLINTKKVLAASHSHYYGLKDRPFFDANKVRLVGATQMSNVPCSEVIGFSDINKGTIASLHWGKEFCFFPSALERDLRHSKFKEFPVVIGHHSHTPQPITFKDNLLTSYSLGNFYIYFNKEMLRFGKILKLSFSEGKLLKIEWQWTTTETITDSQICVGMIDDCVLLS